MAGASAHEEIDEPTGRFLRARDEIADMQRLAQRDGANQMSAAVSRKLAELDRPASVDPAGPTSGLSERHFSHGCPPWTMRCCALKTSQTQRATETESPAESVPLGKAEIQAFFGWRFRGANDLERVWFFQHCDKRRSRSPCGRRWRGGPSDGRKDADPSKVRPPIEAVLPPWGTRGPPRHPRVG
jgi:hypothetical protein